MDEETVNSLCDLTSEQKKAFTNLKKAYKRCLNSGIFFHQILESLHAFNGNNVRTVDDNPKDGYCIQTLDIDYMNMSILSAWADDNHYVHFKSKRITDV